MPRNSFILFLGALVLMAAFYGCTGLQKEPVTKNYFDMNIQGSISNLSQFNTGESLLVKELLMESTFDSHSFVYKVASNKYTFDYYNEFISYPAKLITEKITENLCISPYFAIALTDMKQDITFRLSGKILKLYGDFQDATHPKAIIEIRIILEKKTGTLFKAISGKTYLAEVPLSSPGPAQLVSGWDQGLTKITNQFIKDFQNPAF